MARKKLESVPKQKRTVNKHIDLLPAASEPPAMAEAITPEVKPAPEPLSPFGDQPTIGNLGTPLAAREAPAPTAGPDMVSALMAKAGKLPAGSHFQTLEQPPEKAAPKPGAGFLGRYTDQEIIEEFQKRGLVPEGLASTPAMVVEMVKRLSFIPPSDPADELPEIPEDGLLKTTLLLKLQGEHDALMRLAGHRMGIIRSLKRDLKMGGRGRGPSGNQREMTRKAWDIAREKAKVSGLKAQAHMKEAWAELKAN